MEQICLSFFRLTVSVLAVLYKWTLDTALTGQELCSIIKAVWFYQHLQCIMKKQRSFFFTVWFIPCNITASRHEKCLLGRLLHLSLVKKWSVSWTRNSKVAGSSLSHSAVRSGNNLENVVCTHGASVTNSIIWYWSRGCHALQLER